ncbi:MAG: site-2 protease family protein [Thermoguttaceae bacterium]|nr:site-2 protease family protein [Thermoguttaceae bacterium]
MFGEVQRTRYDVNFSLFGIPVRIHPMFWAVAILFAPQITMPIENMRYWLIGLAAWLTAWIATFIIHEMGHALVIEKIFGARTWIVLYGFGGMACHRPCYRRVPGNIGRILISFAGPACEILAVIVFLAVCYFIGYMPVYLPYKLGPLVIPMFMPEEIIAGVYSHAVFYCFAGWFTYSFIWMGIFWGILNLVPIMPLDGGNILQEILVIFDRRGGYTTAVWISIMCAAAIAFFFMKDGNTFGAIFFAFCAYQNFERLQYQSRGIF